MPVYMAYILVNMQSIFLPPLLTCGVLNDHKNCLSKLSFVYQALAKTIHIFIMENYYKFIVVLYRLSYESSQISFKYLSLQFQGKFGLVNTLLKLGVHINAQQYNEETALIVVRL